MNRHILPSQIELLDESMVEVLKSKTPAERIAMIAAANRTARALAEAGVRYMHPDWDDAQVQAEVRRRVTGGTT